MGCVTRLGEEKTTVSVAVERDGDECGGKIQDHDSEEDAVCVRRSRRGARRLRCSTACDEGGQLFAPLFVK